MRSSSARSSGSWPIARGLRSFGCTSMSVRATLMSPHRSRAAARRRASRRERVERREEAHLGAKVLAAVRHVDRGHASRPAVAPSRSGSRSRTPDARTPGGRARTSCATCSADAGVALRAVPVAPVALASRRARRQLIGAALISCRQRTSGCSRSIHSCSCACARADAVDVPRRDLHTARS